MQWWEVRLQSVQDFTASYLLHFLGRGPILSQPRLFFDTHIHPYIHTRHSTTFRYWRASFALYSAADYQTNNPSQLWKENKQPNPSSGCGFIRIRYTTIGVYYPPRNFIRIRYTTIVVYYPPHNFKGVYGCIKKKSGLRQDGTPPPKKHTRNCLEVMEEERKLNANARR